MPERRPAVKPEARDAHHRELDGQDIALFARRIVARRTKHSPHRAVREGRGIEGRSLQRSAVIPETYRVLADHLGSPRLG
ncbi:hypothetical protein D3C81_1995870 [compost metagenome]